MINYNIKVTKVLENKSKTFTTLAHCERVTGVSEHYIKAMRKGSHCNLIRGKGDVLFRFEFISKQAVVLLSPAWDTAYDEIKVQPKYFTSHTKAIDYLSQGGRYMCKKSSYNRLKNLQPLGEPCAKLIHDAWNRPWIVTFYSKGEFIPNKKKGGE